ncbi:helix-turn-helix domain-containing protein [uncultured Bacteroides sp.]|uniref:helix-turn-helix domain-containing protein n=1 Tax=uncultured Bacteroides sp. TaxID=162156 RepID=UPI002AA72998|nr:helix-turn-helix domain-containing protein [uncultured Bacteroides sp.]
MNTDTMPIIDLSTVQNTVQNLPNKGTTMIDHDFAIFDDISDIPLMDYPSRVNVCILAICLRGKSRVGINLEEYTLSGDQAFIVMPDQILQCLDMTDDFLGVYIVFSKNFLDSILPRLKEILPLFFYLKDHPCIDLTEDERDNMLDYHSFLWEKVKMTKNIFRKEVAQGLLLSMFYDLYNICAPNLKSGTHPKSRQREIFEQFLNEVTSSFKSERSVNYYAKKMYLTPKHISWVVKEISGKTAGEWIDDFVILEAKSLLKSSDMSIQQIAEELHFSNQSFFGKYFKHYTGISPKEYRAK